MQRFGEELESKLDTNILEFRSELLSQIDAKADQEGIQMNLQDIRS